MDKVVNEATTLKVEVWRVETAAEVEGWGATLLTFDTGGPVASGSRKCQCQSSGLGKTPVAFSLVNQAGRSAHLGYHYL